MTDAKLQDSKELTASLERWGLAGEFKSAQLVTEGGIAHLSDTCNVGLEAGSYVVLMNDNSLILGNNSEELARDICAAQQRSFGLH